MHTSRALLTGLVAGASLVLAACGGGDALTPSTPQSATTPPATADSPQSTSEAPTAAEAVANAIAQAPAPPDGGSWDATGADTTGYDPSAAISWISIPVSGADVNDPWRVVLYSNGVYAGTAGGEWQRFAPVVRRTSPTVLQVDYVYQVGAETVQAASGKATITLTWDDAKNAIVQDGETGSDAYQRVNGRPMEGLAGDIENAYPHGGGPLPINATPATTVNAASSTAVFRSPTGRLVCGFYVKGGGSCRIPNWRAEELFSLNPDQPGEKIYAERLGFPQGNDMPEPMGWPGNAPADSVIGSNDAQVLGDGQVIYYGDTVCADTEHGWTCWNLLTGRGAYFNINGYQAF